MKTRYLFLSISPICVAAASKFPTRPTLTSPCSPFATSTPPRLRPPSRASRPPCLSTTPSPRDPRFSTPWDPILLSPWDPSLSILYDRSLCNLWDPSLLSLWDPKLCNPWDRSLCSLWDRKLCSLRARPARRRRSSRSSLSSLSCRSSLGVSSWSRFRGVRVCSKRWARCR